MRVLGISGSLRRDSLNSALLRAAAERLPAGASWSIRAAGEVRPTTRTPNCGAAASRSERAEAIRDATRC
jgi:NAD(P)H-dependent FMN reductase